MLGKTLDSYWSGDIKNNKKRTGYSIIQSLNDTSPGYNSFRFQSELKQCIPVHLGFLEVL